MNTLRDANVNISTSVENQLPFFVAQSNRKFVSFLTAYYESLETKFQPLDIVSNLINYYNIGNYSKTDLIETTILTDNLYSTTGSTTITVGSTSGFPDKNGYIKINDEFIFYESKTDTTFINCHRGTSAFVLEKALSANVVYKTSLKNPDYNANLDINEYTHSHEAGNKVYNLAFNFAEEFFRRIKSEIAPQIPEKLVEELDIVNFLKKVKSFYSAKGSLNSHKILFRILFNDTKVKIRTVNRGTGAKLTVFNYTGRVDGVKIESGGQNYNSTKENNVLISPPIIEIFGSGTGTASNTIIPKTANIVVTDINSSGAITGVSILDNGTGYIGPITARVRERSFIEDEIVVNDSNTGSGRVEYWDFNTNELVLYNVQGYFRINDTIRGLGKEGAVTTISKAYPITTANPEGNPSIQVLSLDPDIEYPKDYIFKPSSAAFDDKKIIKCKCIFNSSKMSEFQRIVSLKQDKDTINGISGVSIESSEFNVGLNNLYEFNIDINRDYKKLYLPQSSVVISSIINIPANTKFILTVDDCYGYPLQNGYLYVNGSIIEYESRSSNQFFNCTHVNSSNISIAQNSEVFEYGYKKYNVQWQGSKSITSGDIVYYNSNIYQALNTGTTSLTPPTHTTGVKSDALFGIKWNYIGNNIIKRALVAQLDFNVNDPTPVEFIPVGLVSDYEIVDSGALYDFDILNFQTISKNKPEDPLFNTFNQNQSNLITSSSYSSYNNSTGVHSIYNHTDHVYVSSSGIPPYLTATNNTRKQFCTNQKLLKRIPKQYSVQKNTNIETSKALKNIGITIDGVEIQSTIGNTIQYGVLNYIRIDQPGEYDVPCTNSNQFDYVRYPVLTINNSTNIKNTNSSTLIYISSKFNSIDLTKLNSTYLTGFTSKPRIKVINNNPNGNPINFENAILDISYNETTGTIDNILIKNPGNGYVVAPTITLEGGGKDSVNLPLKTSSGYVFKFKGGIISAQNYSSATNFNLINVSGLYTTIYKTIPSAVVDAGSDAEIKVYTTGGQLSTIEIVNQGKNYYNTPVVKLLHPTGSNALVIANNDESTGKITSYSVIDRGTNYTSNPIVNIIPSGTGGSISAILKSWTFNLNTVLTNIDDHGGYIYDSTSFNSIGGNIDRPVVTKNNIPYTLDGNQYVLLKTTTAFNSKYSISSTTHSPIIGWAYDGNPIYGPYGYSNPMDSTSSIISMTSKWVLNTTRSGGPSTSEYLLGTFIEDYTNSSTTSKLDDHNGRYCVTPEFPNGVYAYFSTAANFPYLIGPTFYGKSDPFNVCSKRTNDKIPQSFTRVNNNDNQYYPKEYTNSGKTKVKPNNISGKVDSIIIENGGNNYSIGDKIIVDNSETGGIGFLAFVSKLSGKEISEYSFVDRLSEEYIEIVTAENHGLSQGDQVNINYRRKSTFTEYTLNSTTTINYHSNAKLNKSSSNTAKFYLDANKTIPFFDSNCIKLYSSYIEIKTNLCPEQFYIVIGSSTYTVKVEKYFLHGPYNVEIDSNFANKFYIKLIPNVTTIDIDTIYYETISRSATGSIVDCIISNKGINYKSLPRYIKVDSSYGYGAILQLNSSSIGAIKSIAYTGFGDSFTANRTVKYTLNTPFTAKVINNFKISSITVLNGGRNYLPTPDDLELETDYILVDGQKNYPKYQFRINTQLGIITDVDVISGGYNLSKYPTISIYSNTGDGVNAEFSVDIERVDIPVGTLLSCDNNSVIKVLKYNPKNSTIVFEYISGNDFERLQENTTLFTPNGQPYGNLVSIKKAKIYATNSAYSTIAPKFLSSSGFLSDSTQKILDSNYYQDWSYTLKSNRNISEWKTELIENTHAAGFKVFGKNIIEQRSSVFENTTDILRSSVVFKSQLSNKINLKLSEVDCTSQYVYVSDTSNFNVGDYIYGNVSGAIGVVIEKIDPSYLHINILNKKQFRFTDNLFSVSYDFINNPTKYVKYFYCFYNGLLQNPEESYYVSNDQIIPNFSPATNTSIYSYKLTTEFKELISYISISNNKVLVLKEQSGVNFIPGSSQKLIVSIDGVVQNPSTYTVSSNTIIFDSDLNKKSDIFVLYHDKLNFISFSGTGLSRTINYTASTTCNLLLFANSVHQNSFSGNYSLTSSNLVTFSEDPGLNLYGWYIDEAVTCTYVTAEELLLNLVTNIKNCEITDTTKLIESNSIKNPNYYYKFEKELLAGTVTTSSNTVYGYDSSFITTYPEYSSSYVEVLNPITFNGSTKTFALKYADGITYTPTNGEVNLCVYINNNVIDYDQYSISGSNITFVQAYSSTDKCTIIDFNSKYTANNLTNKGVNLDRLNVIQDGSRTVFNLSDNGVPQYVKNTGDIFTIKNNSLLPPSTTYQSVSGNDITITPAPISSDKINLLQFIRQLSPTNTKNVVLDELTSFDGITATWPISTDGVLISPISAYHLFVIRNGVYQKPTIDYTISGSYITFTTVPELGEIITAYYSYNGLDQNFAIDLFKQVDGITNKFALTKNYISTPVISSSNLIISRNGVYQTPNTTYTVGGGTNSRYIEFTNILQPTDSLYITNYKDTDLVNVTNRFTQYNTTTLQYTSQSPAINTDVFLIFVNGVLQVGDAWSFDTATNRLIFTGFVSLTLDEVTILAFQNQKRTFDVITTTTGVETYNLQINSLNITTNLPIESDLIISINGAYQLPYTSYSVSGSTITIPGVPDGSDVYIYQIGNQTTEIIDYFDDNYSKNTYKLLSNYSSVNPSEISDLVLIRNEVIQNPGIDFIAGNGYITFTTNIDSNDNIFILYCHGTDKLNVTNLSGNQITLSATPSALDYNNIVVYVGGIPNFYDENFTITNNTIILSEPAYTNIDDVFVLKFVNVVDIDYFDDYRDGIRTEFRIYYNSQNLNAADIATDADILISINGKIQYPGVAYTLNATRSIVTFTTAPSTTDEIFMVKMHGNTVVNLSTTATNRRYTLDQTILTTERPNLYIFTSKDWCSQELQDFSYVNSTTIDISSGITLTSNIFGIKFDGIVKLLDQINTPFNGSNNKFNMFYNKENFMPIGTIENDAIPSETSLLVVKNGKVLDPGVEYTLQGDIKSQIQFTTAPVSTDVISIKSVGAFLKLKTISSGFGGKVYDLKQQDDTNYYPNKLIKRPREHENQILVIRNGNIQSPLFDYYIDNNKIVFTNNITGTNKLVVLDFMGTKSDVETITTSYEISTGDLIQVSGESSFREVTEVLSPTVLTTKNYTGTYTPSGFAATTTITNGKLTDIAITNSGSGYSYPPIIRTIGSGVSAKVVGTINRINNNEIVEPLTIQYAGNNMYGAVNAIATTYAYSYKKLPLDTASVSLATQLNSSLTSSAETITVKSTVMFEKNTPVVTITSSSGSGASFRPFVSNGRIKKVTILSGGSGYDEKDAVLTVSGGGGSGCVLELTLNSSGTVTAVTVRNSGEGYDTFKAVIANETTNKLEVIEYTDTNSTQLLGCTRPSGSSSHASGTKIYYNFI